MDYVLGVLGENTRTMKKQKPIYIDTSKPQRREYMKTTRLAVNLMAAVAVCLFLSTFAQAQATRTWVSGVGDDANPCSRTAPCKTFAGAISKTAAGGEINCLDPAGFGAVTITKSI